MRAYLCGWDDGGPDGEVAGGGEEGAVVFLKIICSHVTPIKGISLKSGRHNEWCDSWEPVQL